MKPPATTEAAVPGLADMVAPVLAMHRHLRDQRRLFVIVVLTVWIALMLSMATAMLSVAAASALATSGSGRAGRLLIALGAGVLAVGLLAWFEQWFAHVLAYRVIDAIRLRIHRAIARLAPLGLARRRSGETVSAAMTDAESLEWFYAHTAAQVLAGALAAVAISVLSLAWLGPWALVIPAAQALVVLVPVLLLPRAARQGAGLREALAALSAHALSARASARETLLLGRLAEISAQTAQLTRRVQAARRALALRTGFEQALIEATSVVLVLLSLILAADLSTRGRLPADLVPVVVTLAGVSLIPATAITGALSRLGETAAAARRVDALIRTPGIRPAAPRARADSQVQGMKLDDGAPASADVPTPAGVPAPSGAAADTTAGGAAGSGTSSSATAETAPGSFGAGSASRLGSVRVRDLRVRYPDVDRPVLDGVDVDIEAGQMVAVVGPSGVGKTTLALSLARLIAQESGQIIIDGVDTDTEAPERTRERLVLVGQHPHVFKASVRDNLLAPDAPEERIWGALESARLAEHVRALPQGLDTVLAERGAAWSGGERQRLGLARGLLRNPSVLVLDEPTAGLDTRTEAEFLEALIDGRRGRTTIIVTHRRAVMGACDAVVFLHGTGTLTGTHEQLLASSEIYRSVVDGPSTPEPGPERDQPHAPPA